MNNTLLFEYISRTPLLRFIYKQKENLFSNKNRLVYFIYKTQIEHDKDEEQKLANWQAKWENGEIY